MRLGVPTEIKTDEYRVGLIPEAIEELTRAGHQVFAQAGCGQGSGFSDEDYQRAGAEVVGEAAEVFDRAELIVKVKEPQLEECRLLRADHTLFTFLHLAAAPDVAEALLASGATAIAYETVTDAEGGLPLLAPMSEVAGRLAIQAGVAQMQTPNGGRGILLGGVPGVAPAHVVIAGGGTVGYQAARMAVGLGARVTLLDLSLPRLRVLDDRFQGRVACEYASPRRLVDLAQQADLLVGAVLVPGDSAPRLLEREDLAGMRSASVLVDVAIDQGGCFATSRPTTHRNPTFEVDGIIHYGVANIPSLVARTSTLALSHATLPYVKALADGGQAALDEHPGLARGVNCRAGELMHPAVARALNRPVSAQALV